MKCPECGFVSFPGLDRCKKCGHLLTQLPGEPKEVPPLFFLTHKRAKAPAVQGSESGQPVAETAEHDTGELDIELNPENPSGAVNKSREAEPPSPQKPAASQSGQDWQNDLAERVQEYRQRRSRLRNTSDENRDTLKLDFGVDPPDSSGARPNVIEFPTAEELERQSKPAAGLFSASQPSGLENFNSSFQNPGSGANGRSRPISPSATETAPLQIEMESSRDNFASAVRAGEASNSGAAPMSLRIFAGMLDALVLLSGAALYILIFWRAGGEFSLHPLELAISGGIVVFFVMLYFAGCTALASATPGLIWAGLEVATFEGNPPRMSDCLWRGFGYLVSISALMLGFIWAVVDADGLTWHDRMSRTFIVPANH